MSYISADAPDPIEPDEFRLYLKATADRLDRATADISAMASLLTTMSGGLSMLFRLNEQQTDTMDSVLNALESLGEIIRERPAPDIDPDDPFGVKHLQ